MSDLTNPTAAEVRQFLNLGEGDEKQIYHDDAINGYPTHGLGVNLQGKSRKFLLDYITNLEMDPLAQVNHYVFNGTTWVVDANAGKKYLVDEILWLCNETNTTHRPFDTNSPIANENLLMLNISNKPNASAQAFDQVVYQAYLGGTDDGYNIVGVRDIIKDNIWEKLTKRERLALYSLNYNSPTGDRAYIGSGTLSALNLYTNGASASQKFIGKLGVWYQILYCCNSEPANLNHGIQNRRFLEANEFLERPNNSKPDSASEAQSIIPINSYEEANIAIAFMNQNKEAMKNKLDDITNYKNNPYKYIRDNFSSAVSVFLSNQNYTQGYNINTLFTDWNLYTDLQINTSTGTTSYSNITGSDKQDLIFITGNQNGTTVHAGAGDDFVGGSSNNDVVYSGSGKDVIYTYGGNDTVYTTDGTASDYNTVYLGAGSDTFKGGAGDDFVDGGSGAIGSHVSSNIDAEDATTDVNDIDLGGGQNRYIGGKGTDKVKGSGYNTVYLGAGSDEYTGGNDVDVVDGGKLEDSIFDINKIDLGGGADIYYGGAGKDIVEGGSGNDKIYAGDGDNEINGGTGHDIIKVGNGNNKIHAGTGRDSIYLGVGNNEVYLGKDDQRDDVFLGNAAGYTDHIYNCSSNDYIHYNYGIASKEYQGKDMIVTLTNGAKVHFHDFTDQEPEDPSDPEYNPPAGAAGAPFIVLPDDGTILGYGSNGQGYVDTGYKMPKNPIGDNGDKKKPERSGPGNEIPEEGTPPPPPYDKDPEDNDSNPPTGPDGPDDGLGGEGDRKISQSEIDNPNANKPTLSDYIPRRGYRLPLPQYIQNNVETAETTRSPLIIDLDGDGVETSKAEDGVYFDHDGNGFAEKSGWVGQDDGLLVRDINGNGEIDNGTELFGNNSVLSSGEKAANGFEALKDLDSNGDGVFNAEDNAWSEVKIWQDANGNGKVDSNELITLEQANIIMAA